jgi:tetratricopeptide (TPR) repeat protein
MSRSLRGLVSITAAAALLVAGVWAAADQHFRDGYALFKQKKYAEALAELKQSSEMNGNDYNFFLLLANTYAQLKQWRNAVGPASKAASIDPSKKEAHVLLGTAHLRSEGYAEAAEAYSAAVKMEPNDFQLVASMGYAYYKAGDNSKAIPALEKAMTLKGDDVTTLFALGAAYVKERQCAKAEPVLDKVKTLEPRQEDAIQTMMLGCYSASGDNAKAIQEAKEAFAKDPKDVRSLTFLAQSSMAMEKWDEAMDYYRKLSALKPKEGEPHFRIAQIHTLKKEYTDAIAAFEKALSLDNKCEWHVNLGTVHQTQAAEIDNKIGNLLAEDPDAKPDQAELDQMMGQYGKARDEYNKAVKACKSADAKKGLDSVKERVAAWQKYSDEAAAIERGEAPEEPAEQEGPSEEKKPS